MKTVKQWMHIKEVVMLWLGVGDGGESCCHAIVCDGDDIVEVVNFFVNRNMHIQAQKDPYICRVQKIPTYLGFFLGCLQ